MEADDEKMLEVRHKQEEPEHNELHFMVVPVDVEYFVKNKDSSIRPTDEAIATFKLAGVPQSNEQRLMISGLDELVKKEPGSVTLGPDAFSSLGGEHSTYTYIGSLKDENGIPTVLFTLTDKQELNPQWILSSKIKNKFKLNPNSFTYKTVDKLGGINLSRLIGFKPFTQKLGIAVQPGKGDYNIKYFDPTGLN